MSKFGIPQERAEELEMAWNRLAVNCTAQEVVAKMRHLTSLNVTDAEVAYLGYRLGQSHVIQDLHNENILIGEQLSKMDWTFKWVMRPSAVVAVIAAIFSMYMALGGYERIAARNGWTPPKMEKEALPEYLRQKVYSEMTLYSE